MNEEMNEESKVITDENIADLQWFVSVGGAYHINALQLPPQVKQIKDGSKVEVNEERDCNPCSWRVVLDVCPHHICSVRDLLSSKLKDQVTNHFPVTLVHFLEQLVGTDQPALRGAHQCGWHGLLCWETVSTKVKAKRSS